jgi:serine/threonine protein kinase/WD40 repeat protein
MLEQHTQTFVSAPAPSAVLEAAVSQFEQAWQAGRQPCIDDFLPPDTADRALIFVELVCTDMELRLKAGLPVRIEVYFEKHPELTRDRAVALDLIATEYALRKRYEANLTEKEYIQRFPHLRDQLSTLLKSAPQRSRTTAMPASLPVIPGYEILATLGQGGMGSVYKAQHIRLKRIVALKVIRKEFAAAAQAVERFQREAEAAAQLDHPNILRVYDAGESTGSPYLAMEYIDGIDLVKLVRQKGPLQVAEACDVARQVAIGLQHAHEHGLVHRDIKPHNLMRTREGIVKILDFGLARLSMAGNDPHGEGLTASGVVLGTPDYIAPEQAMNARGVDIRADLYSLGCSLFHLLTGRPLFLGDSLTEKLLKHQLTPPPLDSLAPEVPPGLVALLQRLLAKNPDERYQTPAEVAAALTPFCQTVPYAVPLTAIELPAGAPETMHGVPFAQTLPMHSPALPATVVVPVPRRVGRWSILAILVLLAVFIGMVAWHFRDGSIPPNSPIAAVSSKAVRSQPSIVATTPILKTARELRRFQGQAGGVYAVAISADGSRVAAGVERVVELWDTATGKEIERFTGHTDVVISVALSSDGRQVLSGSKDNTMRLWKPGQAAAVRHWTTERPNWSVRFSPDDHFVVAAGDRRIWDATTGKEAIPFGPLGDAVAFSRNGERLLSGSFVDGLVRLWDVKSGTELHRYRGHTVRCVGLSPDLDWVLAGQGPGANDNLAIPGADYSISMWNAETEEVIRTFRGHTHVVFSVAVAPDGRRILSGSFDKTVRLWNAQTGETICCIRDHIAPVWGVAFGPDGRQAISGSLDSTVRLWQLPE